jgi:hypothetical protein
VNVERARGVIRLAARNVQVGTDGAGQGREGRYVEDGRDPSWESERGSDLGPRRNSMSSTEHPPLNQPSSSDVYTDFGRFGSTPLGMGTGQSMADTTEVISAVSDLLNCPVRYVDANGYTHEITAGAVNPILRAVAAVHCKSKTLENNYVDIEFRLKAQVDGRGVTDWLVETYNPYFGCDVRYMAWHDRSVVMIYREKHHTYACSHSDSGMRQLVQLTDEWLVTANQIICRSEEPNLVDRFALPDLNRLPPMSADEARQAGMLPPDYDRWNEWHKKYQRERTQRDKPKMNEAGWFSSIQPQEMLTPLRGNASERKLRLFGVACCRRIWGEIRDERSRRAVEIAEEFAEGRCDKPRLSLARQEGMTASGAARLVATSIPRTVANLSALRAAHVTAEAANAAQQVAAEDAYQATCAVAGTTVDVDASIGLRHNQCGLLRCIFGPTPFRSIRLEPTWATQTVLRLAQVIYSDRAFDSLPILADALEDAGCDNADILAHCRGPGPHVLGCWVVDLILGKG